MKMQIGQKKLLSSGSKIFLAGMRRMLPHLIDEASRFSGEILMTQDSHYENYLDTQEGKCCQCRIA